MTEKNRSWLVIFIFVAFAVVGYAFFLNPFLQQEPDVDKVLKARSTWTVTLQSYRQSGPIGQETYRISNDNGASKMFYSASNRDGTLTKWFDAPLSGPNATFLFQQLDADGVWQLDDKAIRPNSKEQYIVQIAQTLGDEGGSRAIGFSDPRYWATTKAEEFQLRLPAKSMRNFKLTDVASAGRSVRDPRYLKIVDEISAFGPQSVLDAENKIRAELSAMPTQASLPHQVRKTH